MKNEENKSDHRVEKVPPDASPEPLSTAGPIQTEYALITGRWPGVELLLTQQNRSDFVVIPLLLTVEQTCIALNCGRTTVFSLLASGELERRKINRATRVTLRSILKFAGHDDRAAL